MLSLTATELQRFMSCNGFKSLNGVEPFNPSTEQTDEGNAVHWLAEQFYNGFNPVELIDRKAPNGVFITAEMVEHCQDYFKLIDYNGQVEVDTSHGGNGWEIRGRADYIGSEIENKLVIADLKYGWRIVEPEMNWTLISHAIAQCAKRTVKPEQIIFRIYQPRAFHPRGNIREWVISFDELMGYYEQLKNVLEHPQPTVNSGSQCYKCKSLSQCPAAQIATMNAIDVSQMAFNNEIDNDTLSWMITNIKRGQEVLKQACDAYEDLALHRLKVGKQLKGFAIQPSLGQTAWSNETASDLIKAITGIDITVKKIVTPAQAKKLGVSEDLIKDYTYRPDNGLKLVQIDESKLANKLFGDKK